MAAPCRVLCLGNDILADDSFGIAVARELRRLFGDKLEIAESNASGFGLLDDLIGVDHLLVVDVINTGNLEPGTIKVLRETDVTPVPGGSPHFVGLFDILSLARTLDLHAPEDVTIIAVEAADCLTVGGEMHPAVRAAIPNTVELAAEWVRRFS